MMKSYLPSLSLAVTIIYLLLQGCDTTIHRGFMSERSAAAHTVDNILALMPARNAFEARLLSESLLELGPAAIASLCDRLAPNAAGADSSARYALQGLTNYLGRSGNDAWRRQYAGLLSAKIETGKDPDVQAFLIRQLQRLGSKAAMPALQQYITDPRLGSPAIAALVHLGGPDSEAAFLKALHNRALQNRIDLVQALGKIRSKKAVPDILALFADRDVALRRVARYAAAEIAEPRVAAPLRDAVHTTTGYERDQAFADLLRYAERRNELGFPGESARICREILQEGNGRYTATEKIAALGVLTHVLQVSALPEMIQAFEQGPAPIRKAAMALIADLPGEAVTRQVAALLPKYEARRRAQIVAMLGQRGDRVAFPAVTTALRDTSAEVRRAAITATARLDPGAALQPLLLALRECTNAEELSACRNALLQITGPEQKVALMKELPQTTGAAKAALLEILSSRVAEDVAELLLLYAKDEDADVRLAAIRGLARAGKAQHIARIIALYAETENTSERNACRKAVATIVREHQARQPAMVTVSEKFAMADSAGKMQLLRLLPAIGGEEALNFAVQSLRSSSEALRDAALRTVTAWPSQEAVPVLLNLAGNTDLALRYHVLALRACARLLQAGEGLSVEEKISYYQQGIKTARRTEEKKMFLSGFATLNAAAALEPLAAYFYDDSLKFNAAFAAARIVAELAAEAPPVIARLAQKLALAPLDAETRMRVSKSLYDQYVSNAPPEGFRPLFNGKDLSGWRGFVASPPERRAMMDDALAIAQARADSLMRAHWRVEDGVLIFDGEGQNICTEQDFSDFELLVDWKIEKGGDSGIYLRGSPQVQIWDPAQWAIGSGGLYNNQIGPSKPLAMADKPVGEWNRFRILMIGERVTVYLNDTLVVDNVVLENYWERDRPIYATGPIELQAHHTPLYFKNIFIREIPRRPAPFVGALFNGEDLTGWRIIGGTEESWRVKDGILIATGKGGGWLSSTREFANFKLELEFRVTPGGNSGVFLRAPHRGDPAYTGMEIQILDDYAKKYAKLKPWQYTGSIYAVQAPAMRASRRANQWQKMEILCNGPSVRVTLNGTEIINTNLIDHMHKTTKNPGLKRRRGYIGLQNHGSVVWFRNIRVEEFPPSEPE